MRNELINKNQQEFVGQIMDVIEDYVSKRESRLFGTDPEDVHIKGSEYDGLSKELRETLTKWGVLEEIEKEEKASDGEYLIISWNDEWLQQSIVVSGLSLSDAKKKLRETTLERLVQLDIAETSEEAEKMYEEAEKSTAGKWETTLSIGDDTVSILYGGGYEERISIVKNGDRGIPTAY